MSKSFNNTILVIDSGCDLPLQYVKQDNIVPLGLIFNFKGKAVEDDFGENFNLKDFYNALRQGEMPTTSQINSEKFVEVFRKYVSEGKSIIYIEVRNRLEGGWDVGAGAPPAQVQAVGVSLSDSTNAGGRATARRRLDGFVGTNCCNQSDGQGIDTVPAPCSDRSSR